MPPLNGLELSDSYQHYTEPWILHDNLVIPVLLLVAIVNGIITREIHTERQLPGSDNVLLMDIPLTFHDSYQGWQMRHSVWACALHTIIREHPTEPHPPVIKLLHQKQVLTEITDSLA